ncbi:ATP12 family chaperone protein [Pseudoprimorskyibacter insulae]|uniref:ATP12 chaperone protein n=1 Tax=Pseudoprimorskyibacter insulae TaxID=1695997 RepID=A0A2R8ANZ8_9RHOB|nr:ATP12 family protein [Pseudoprimorskyibacter insulae]SPF77788.1 hypothetical protein PRI8871_00374 [Pseudoprimorskyibacter insulae]
MSEWALKRFWKTVVVEEADGGYAVKLDGRGIKTPAKAPLSVPTRALAESIAAEWDAQAEHIDPNTMPCTRSANAAIDKVRHQHAEVADMLADYGDSDLLCYRAETPQSLVDRQNDTWNPLIDWAESRYGVRLLPRAGVMHAPQTPETLATLRAEVHQLDPFAMAAFHDLVSMSGSLVLGLAALHDDHAAEDIWNWSRLDEIFQEEQWGEDEEATEVATRKKSEFLHAHRFYRLSRPVA